jgi:lactoylglutathione lyase
MKMDHVVIYLSDLVASIGFYDTLLPLIGFQKDRDHVFGNSDGNYLDFRQATMPDHRYERFAPGLNHIGFAADSRDTVVAIKESMRDAGFDVAAIQEFPDGSALFLKDADGMRIEIGSYN